MKSILFPSSILLFAVACGGSQTPAEQHHHDSTAAEHAVQGTATQDIVGIAASNTQFSTLVAALKAAELVETLQSQGPFTVFAPTNAAFAKLPAGTVEALLADKEKLTQILTYHVVAGKVMAADVVGLTSAKSLQGQSLAIDTADGVKIGNAAVVKTDLTATNGVIHVIDTVLIPGDS